MSIQPSSNGGGLGFGLFGAELAAAGGDVDAAALADGAGEAAGAEDALEFAGGGAGGGGAGEAVGGVEGNEVDVGVEAGEEGGDLLGVGGGVVGAGDEGPLEEDAALGFRAVEAASVDEFG